MIGSLRLTAGRDACTPLQSRSHVIRRPQHHPPRPPLRAHHPDRNAAVRPLRRPRLLPPQRLGGGVRGARRRVALPRAPRLQGHGHALHGDIAQVIDILGGDVDAFTGKEYTSFYRARTRRADRHGPRPAHRHRHLAALHRRRPGVGARRHPRRDQDGRGHARRSRARDLRHRVLARPPARPPDPRHRGDGATGSRASRSSRTTRRRSIPRT